MRCTTIEQSQHLLELGLSSETADMVILHEEPYETSDSMFDGLHKVLTVPFKEYDKRWKQKYKNISYFPAWSMDALSALMPERCDVTKAGYVVPHHIVEIKDPINVAFQLICYLLENNYIKKGE